MKNNSPNIFFRVKNFKSLENAEVQLSPLTFFFGPNGSGKSSLFKALKFLNANLFPLEAKQLKFKLDEHTDLGSYKEIVINGNTSKRIIMEMEVDSSVWNKIIKEQKWIYEDELEESIHSFNYELSSRDLISLKYPVLGDYFTKYKITDDRKNFEIKSDYYDEMEEEERKEYEKEYFYLETRYGSGGDLMESLVKAKYSKYNLSLPFKIRIEFSLRDDLSVIDLIRIDNLIDKSFIEYYPSIDADDNSRKTISIFNNSALDEIFQYFYDNFWGLPFQYDNFYEFMGAVHKFIYHKVQNLEVWQKSSYEQKKNIYNKIKYWYHFIYQYVPYFLESLFDINHLPPVREEPKEMYLLKDNDFSEAVYYGLPSYLEKHRRNNFLNKKLNEFKLAKGIRIKKEKSVGFLQYKPNEKNYYTGLNEASSGLLHVLPVLFKCSIEGKLFIEQPELHLHPRLQSLLAEYFVKEIGNKYFKDIPFFLIETHSEHLIRKIQVCIAKKIIDKTAVTVYYFDKNFNTGKTTIKRMDLSDNGFFNEPWPDGFFDETYNLTKELLRASKN